ncbi:hypothetical protein ACFL0M_00015 [Thermodesulfobacteriota bacterium]
MRVPSYQIHNVLKLYSKQLIVAGTVKSEPDVGRGPTFDDKPVITGGMRREIISKTTAEIIAKITRFDSRDSIDLKIEGLSQRKPGGNVPLKDQGATEFIFNRINDDNHKITTTLSFEDPTFLIKRLEKQIAEAVNSKKQENL